MSVEKVLRNRVLKLGFVSCMALNILGWNGVVSPLLDKVFFNSISRNQIEDVLESKFKLSSGVAKDGGFLITDLHLKVPIKREFDNVERISCRYLAEDRVLGNSVCFQNNPLIMNYSQVTTPDGEILGIVKMPLDYFSSRGAPKERFMPLLSEMDSKRRERVYFVELR